LGALEDDGLAQEVVIRVSKAAILLSAASRIASEPRKAPSTAASTPTHRM